MTDRSKLGCSGNIDPRQVDVRDKPKRKRKPTLRKREALPENLEQPAAEAERRVRGRRANPGVMLEPEQTGDAAGHGFISPHASDRAWQFMVADAFGTSSMGVVRTFLIQLTGLCQQSYDYDNFHWKPHEHELNAALAIINSTKPKDELGAVLAANAVALHWMQMRGAKQALGNHASYIDPRTATAAARLSNAIVNCVDGIDRRNHKRKPTRQVIIVKRETHHHTHKHVHLGGEGAGNGGQPHASEGETIVGESIEYAAEPTERPALPSPDKGRTAMPNGRRKGKASLPDARRGERIWGAKGRGER